MKDDIVVFDAIKAQFERDSGLEGLNSTIVIKSNVRILVIYVSHPTDRFFSILESVRKEHASEDGDMPIATLTKRSHYNILDSAKFVCFAEC